MLSSRLSLYLERAVTPFLQHKCTLISYEDTGVDDEEGQNIYDEVVEKNIKCLFLWKDVAITDSRGTIVTRTPTLYLLPGQTVLEGQQVRDLKDRRNNVLLKSAKINTINQTAEAGSSPVKVCSLEGAVI